MVNNRLQEWNLSFNVIDIFLKMCEGAKFDNKNRRTDHGITSSIMVMKAIDKKYEINNPHQTINPQDPWNFNNMEFPITNLASAIFIHNLELDELTWDFHHMPLATLLKLCDELQDWGRPSASNLKGESPVNYDIQYDNNILTFKVAEDRMMDIIHRVSKIINFPIHIELLD